MLGGDGVVTPTMRTLEQTQVGIFCAYDGTPSLCAPPRLYNQIAVQIAAQMGTGGVALARLLALVNLAMADAGIAVWESKYYHDFWRPVTGIREADPGSGPTGAGDGNPATSGDPTFTPLLLALGLSEFSLHPGTLLEVRRRIRECDLATLKKRVPALMRARDRSDIEAWVARACAD